jgi:hypothetical protein
MIHVFVHLNNQRVYVHSILNLTCKPHERLSCGVVDWLQDQGLVEFNRFYGYQDNIPRGTYRATDYRYSPLGPGFEFNDINRNIAMLFKLTWVGL